MKKALMKDTIKEIKNTFKRFISILLIVLLGVGFFVGIKATSPDMKNTIDKYFDNQNVMDIGVISTLGLTDKDLEELRKVEGVSDVSGTYETDVIVNSNEKDFVIKLSTYQNDVNKLVLKDGEFPKNSNECVVESSFLIGTKHKIGDTIEIQAEDVKNDEGETEKLLKENKVKIVGTVESPLYISRERGSSKLGSGTVNYYMFVPKENLNPSIYTNAYISVANAKEEKCYSKKYENKVEDVKDNIDKVQDERKEARYREIYDEANKKIEDAQKEFDDEKAKADNEIKDAEEKLNNGKKDLENGKNELTSQKNKADTEFGNAKRKISKAEKELKNNENELNNKKTEADKKITEAQGQVENLKKVEKQYSELNSKLETLKLQVINFEKQVSKLNPQTDAQKIAQINEQIKMLNKNIMAIQGGIAQIGNTLKSQGIEIDNLSSTIQTIETTITNSKNEISNAEKMISNGKKELSNQKKKLEQTKNSTYSKINKAENELNKAEQEIKDNEVKLDNAKKEANDKIKEAEGKLEDARLKLKDIKRPEWYILDRNQNVGYVSYLQDTDRIANIAKVFPIIFFVVATLISLTTMTRMVEEERVQIGTLKALGYTKLQIASKYIIYATIATVIGGVIGMFIGFNLIPRIILSMYAMMYTIPILLIEFNVKYALIGLLTAIICTVGAAIYSCAKSLVITPAGLMRPKAPKPGKRVFLEKIPFIWKRLNFTKKVTARNIFRYKKRFLMTVIGICGCTSLIIAGFGLRDAVSTMIPSQYGEIFKFSMQVSLKDNLKKEQIEEVLGKIKSNGEIKNTLKAELGAIEISNIENNQTIQLVVPENTENVSEFIELRNFKNKKEKYTLNDTGVIITKKLADVLGIKNGDTITLKNVDDVEVNVKVEGITENYLMHYIYMSPSLYANLYGEEIIPNSIFTITENLTEEQENALGKNILANKELVSGVSFVSSTTGIFNEVMKNMNVVVLILIVSAGLLALVVLYNLSNTNISERIRELATIKVLGFYDKEVYDYVAKETVLLTIMGILLGLIGGIFLTVFIIKTCELDMFMFNPQIKPITFVYGILLTAVFAGIVNIATYFSLKKINMIESLKSVE